MTQVRGTKLGHGVEGAISRDEAVYLLILRFSINCCVCGGAFPAGPA
jgi:hypothetical protein